MATKQTPGDKPKDKPKDNSELNQIAEDFFALWQEQIGQWMSHPETPAQLQELFRKFAAAPHLSSMMPMAGAGFTMPGMTHHDPAENAAPPVDPSPKSARECAPDSLAPDSLSPDSLSPDSLAAPARAPFRAGEPSLHQLLARIDSLEKRIAALEQRAKAPRRQPKKSTDSVPGRKSKPGSGGAI